MGLYEQVMEAVVNLAGRIHHKPRIGVVLGSGLRDVEDRIDNLQVIPYNEIPHFPRPTAPGHAGNLLLGTMNGRDVAFMQGRFHYYEGYSTVDITFPIRVLNGLGIETLIQTNAAGGLHPLFHQGDIMIIADHMHLIPENPLRGITDERLGNPYPDLSQAYDSKLMEIAQGAALSRGIHVTKGIYVGVAGPSLETPAETRLLRAAGADAVGMSTTSEIIVARSLNMRVLGLSVICNVNRPDCMAPILVDEILAASQQSVPRLMDLISGVIERI
jgi:purine-nucleoside phosphorylase